MNHPILIRRLTGTNKGKDEILHTQEVSFGTGPNNTVRFDPTWDRGVSSSHARLYRDAEGVWWLADAGSSTGTFLNGQKLTQPRALVGSFVIELGQSGPRVEVTLPADALPARDQRPSGPAHLGQGGGGRGPARKSSKLPIAIAALIALGLGALWLLRPGGGSVTINIGGEDSDTQLEVFAKRMESAVGKVLYISADGELAGSATAWAVAPGIFATNGHVTFPAQALLKNGGAVFIALNKQPEKKLRVVQAITHPQYQDDIAPDYRPLLNHQGKKAANAYDVGLLIVKETSPVTFKLASNHKAARLDSGKRVAFIGFPAKDLMYGGSDNDLPVATMQTGIITAVTDFWGNQANSENRLLVQHSLPCTGGASGSPIFDAEGEVVAVLNAGSVTPIYSTTPKRKFDHYVSQAAAMLNLLALKLGMKAGSCGDLFNQRKSEIQAVKLALPKLDKEPGLVGLDLALTVLKDLKEKVDQLKPDWPDAEKDKTLLAALARFEQLIEIKAAMVDITFDSAPSAALINYAMRVDVLKELLDTYQKSAKQNSAQ